MKFVIEHLSKSFEKKEVLRDLILHLMKGKFMGCSAETALEKQRCLTV